MALNIETISFMGSPLLLLVGRVSDKDARELSHEIHALFKNGNSRIVIDVTRVIFMDSHGLGVIVYYSQLMKNEGKSLLLLNANRNPTAYMNRLFDMTSLDKVLDIAASKEAL
ncbi:MAG: STAS domain-containing protein [Chitinivibrionales bacterium]|nr:STAS domain-containing protein [Chitinivibrionales bacterium]